MIDPDGKVTKWSHDLQGRVTRKTYYDNTFVSYFYDDIGRLKSRLDALQQETTYKYNLDDSISEIAYPGSSNTSTRFFLYDQFFRRLTAAQNDWGTLMYAHNPYIDDITSPGHVFLSGKPTLGDTVTLTFHNTTLWPSGHPVQYTVASGVTSVLQLADAVASAVNSDTTLSGLGIKAAAVTSKSQAILLQGAISAGNVLTFVATNADLPSGSDTLQLTVLSGETLPQLAARLTAAINVDANLQGLGVLATSNSSMLQLNSSAPTRTTYAISFSGGTASAMPATLPGMVAISTNASSPNVTVTAQTGGTQSESAAVGGGGQLSSVLNSVIPNSEIAYSHDALERTIKRMIDGSNNAVVWEYDQMGRVTKEYNELSTNPFEFKYVNDALNASKGSPRLDKILYPNGQETSFAWLSNNEDQRLAAINNILPGTNGGSASRFAYRYDPAGQITRWTQEQGPQKTNFSFEYDEAGQLASAQAGLPGANLPLAEQHYYNYDKSSNRTSVQTDRVQQLELSGAPNSGDVITVTAHSPALPGGQRAVAYTQTSADTDLDLLAQKVAAELTADPVLQSVGVNAVPSGASVSVRSVWSSPIRFSVTSSGSATSARIGLYSTSQTITVGGTVAAGHDITLTIRDPIFGANVAQASYETQSGDSVGTIADALASDLTSLGSFFSDHFTVGHVSGSPVIVVRSTSPNVPNYVTSVEAGGAETLTALPTIGAEESFEIAGTPNSTPGTQRVYLTVGDAALSAPEAISYQVVSGNDATAVAAGLATAINGNANLKRIAVSATASNGILKVVSASSNATTFLPSKTATQNATITRELPRNRTVTAVLGGTPTLNDVVAIKVFNSKMTGTGGVYTASRTVLSTDTLNSIADALVTSLNTLNSYGISATKVLSSNGTPVINLASSSTAATSYDQYVRNSSNGAGTEIVALSPSAAVVMATHNSVNALTNLTSGGKVRFSATTDRPVKSASVSSAAVALTVSKTAYAVSVENSPAGITAGRYKDGAQLFSVTGKGNIGDTLSLTVHNTTLSGGKRTISYPVSANGTTKESMTTAIAAAINSDTQLDPLGISATVSGARIRVSQALALDHLSTYSVSETVNPADLKLQQYDGTTQVINVTGIGNQNDILSVTVDNSALAGGEDTVEYTVAADGTSASSMAAALANAINADTTLDPLGISATSSGAQVTIVKAANTYSQSVGSGSSETVHLGPNLDGNSVALIDGSRTASSAYNLTLTVHNSALSGGQKAITYSVQTTDSLVDIASAVASAVNSDSSLTALGLKASNADIAKLTTTQSFTANPHLATGSNQTKSSAVSGGNTTGSIAHDVSVLGNAFTRSVSPGASETITFSENVNGNTTATIGGAPGTGDVLTISVHAPALINGFEQVSYSVQSTDTLSTIATELKDEINANPVLQDLGLNATASGQVITIITSGGTGNALSFDANGNLLSDGVNGFAWDAENRLIKITYPGSGNQSELSYDAFGRCVKIWRVERMREPNSSFGVRDNESMSATAVTY